VKLFSSDAKVDGLRQCSLFERLSRADLARIAQVAEDGEVDAEYVLCSEGDTAREFYVIVEGQVDVRKGDHHLATLGPGDYFGELALLDHATRTASVTAKTPLRFFVVTSEAFWPLIESTPQLAQELLRTVAKRSRAAFSDSTS
jgi:CRP-like cAMP-binding protein